VSVPEDVAYVCPRRLLTIYSAFFKQLLEVRQLHSFVLAPLEIEHDSRTVRVFLDLVVVCEASMNEIPTTVLVELFSICDLFQMVAMEAVLSEGLKSRLQGPPDPANLDSWSIFKFAANRADIELARDCIKAFEAGGIQHHTIYRAHPSYFDSIPSNYCVDLLLAGYEYSNHDPSDNQLTGKRSWDLIAKSFSPLNVT
jgi:hypothetical protein